MAHDARILVPESLFDPTKSQRTVGSIFLGLFVALVGFGCAALAWFVNLESREDKVSTLRSFVDNAILVAQKDGALNTQDTILRLGQISRPANVDFFLFNADQELVHSSRVEMNVGMNFGSWLVTPNMTLAALLQKTPPGTSAEFDAVLQAIRGWKPQPGNARLAYIPGSAYSMLAFHEAASQSDILHDALDDLRWSGALALLLGFVTGGVHWLYRRNRFLRQQMLWETSVNQAATAVILAIKNRSQIRTTDVPLLEMRHFLQRLRPVENQLSTISQAEALMASAEESARAVLNAVGEIIFVVDDKNDIVWANRQAEEFMEVPRNALLGSPLALYGAEPSQKTALQSGLAAARQGSGGTFFWSCRKLNTGQVFPVEVWANKISLSATDAICVALRDISAQRKSEAELRRMVQDLQTALERGETLVRSQGIFLARMSHEIRAPINAVIGLCQLGRDGSVEETPEVTLQRIESSARDLLRVVDDVLDCAKLEAGKISVFAQPFEMEKLLHEVKRFCKVRASGRPLHFEVSARPDLPKFLSGDAGRIKQILINFCENAIKFTQAGVISVEASPGVIDPTMVRFRVTDLGIGIPASKQHQLFQEFSQADPTIGRQYGGSGLGLSICKMLVDAMGGKIGLISQEGQGSTFWFEIPLPAVESASLRLPVKDTAVSVPDELKGLAVLLADDEDINRMLVTRLLESAGCRVEACTDGAEVFEKVLAKDYELAILDLEMPEMDGFRTLESIRKLPGSKGLLPTFAMSSHLREYMEARVRQAGFCGYFTKPIEAATLFPSLVQALTIRNGGQHSAPAGTTEAPRLSTYNPVSGQQRLGGDLALFDAMTNRFIERWCSDGEGLLNQIRAGGDQAIRLAHTLRGAAATIGANEVAELAASLESNLRKDLPVADALAELLPSLQRVHAAILAQRKNDYLAAAAPPLPEYSELL